MKKKMLVMSWWKIVKYFLDQEIYRCDHFFASNLPNKHLLSSIGSLL